MGHIGIQYVKQRKKKKTGPKINRGLWTASFFHKFKMAAITKWFVFRSATPAERDAVADFVAYTICRYNRDSSAHPYRTFPRIVRIFDEPDGWSENRLNCAGSFLIPDNQTT